MTVILLLERVISNLGARTIEFSVLESIVAPALVVTFCHFYMF